MIETLNDLKKAADERVELGLMNFWYPVIPGYQVSDRPIGVTRLSENIVLWRDGDGKVHATEDRCPHRGARLSLGWNLGDKLACWYHGVEVDGTGTVVDVPAMKTCSLKGKQCIKGYPVQEAAGAVFLWFGDDLHQEPRPFELPVEMTGDEYSGFLCMQNWACNYRYAVDNVMDPMHGTYLHSQSHSMADGDRQAEMEVVETGQGLICQKTGQRGINFDWVEFGVSAGVWMRLAVPYRKQYGGGEFIIVGFVTPVDEKHCQVYFWRIKKVQGFERNVWRFMYRTKLEGLHWDVLEQDRAIIENMVANARSVESLYQHDIGIVKVRRLMERLAQEQVSSLHAQAA